MSRSNTSEGDPKDPPGLRRKCLLAEGAIGGDCVPLQVRFGLERDESFGMHEAGEHADREGAAAESEHPDAVVSCRVLLVSPVVVAQKFVEIEHVALDADAEREADECEGSVMLDVSDTIAEDRDLLAVAQVEGLIKTPHIGLERLRCAVAGPVREGNQFSWRTYRHPGPPRLSLPSRSGRPPTRAQAAHGPVPRTPAGRRSHLASGALGIPVRRHDQ